MNAIEVNNLTKVYKLYASPKDRLKEALSFNKRKFHHEFYALNGVSFNVEKGQTVGIIGQNGSGKSTLLQIICGVLQPTCGGVGVKGRVAALLELGAGFNPEFTGRDNVYMNGALMGFSQDEMKRRFPEITAFAEIGEFIDQPVKTYSSGMLVRLAFACAVNVDPEILVIDEALAVGDLYFQHKCMNALKRRREAGATVLFVSHDGGTIKGLCSQAIWLEGGCIKAIGAAEGVADDYLKFNRDRINEMLTRSGTRETATGAFSPLPATSKDVSPRLDSNKVISFQEFVKNKRSGTGEIKFEYFEMTDSDGRVRETFEYNSLARLNLFLRADCDVQNYYVAYHVRDRLGIEITGSDTAVESLALPPLKAGEMFGLRCEFNLPLKSGTYSILILASISKNQHHLPLDPSQVRFSDWIDNAYVFNVEKRKEADIWSAVYMPTRMTIL